MSSSSLRPSLGEAVVLLAGIGIGVYCALRDRDRTRATEAADSVIAVADSIQPTKHIHPIPPPSVHDATSSSNPTGAHASNDEPEAKGNQAVLEEAAVLALVRSDFPLWRDSPTLQELDASRFHVRPLTGGSSNTLWLLSLHAPAPDTLEPETPAALVVRFYGASTGAFVERDVEALVADLLSSGGVGARIFHHFTPTPASAASASASSSKPVLPHPAGRIEQFIAGRTLLHDELLIDSIGTGIAAELAKLHVIPVPSEGEYAAIPRHPQLFVNAWKWMQLACHARLKLPREGRSSVKTSLDDVYSLEYGHRLYESFGMPSFDPSVWTSSKISSLPFSPSSLSQLPPEFGQNRWVRELQWMQELLDNWNASGTTNKRAGGGTLKLTKAQSQRATDAAIFSQIGLCHNDLNPANILYVEPSSDPSEEEDAPSAFAPPPFTLIDFEYATFNPPSYDLANHFCEYALDYTLKGWPFFESKHAGFFMAQEKMIDRLRAYAEEKSKHMWALWSVIQSSTAVYSVEGRESWREEGFKVPPLAYLEYAETRFEMYREIKRLWLEANGSPAADDQFPEPPKWQMFDQEKQWTDWTERLRPMHEKIRQIKLQSTERQAAAWARYEAAAAKA